MPLASQSKSPRTCPQTASLLVMAMGLFLVTACAEVGDSCTSNIQCGTGICIDGTCARSCDGPDDATCEDGLSCLMYETRSPDGGVTGGGYACARPVAAVGSACGSGTNCVSEAACIDGVCRAQCDPFGVAVCATSELCSLRSGGGHYCVPF